MSRARPLRLVLVTALLVSTCASSASAQDREPEPPHGPVPEPGQDVAAAPPPEHRGGSPLALAFLFWSVGEALIPDVRWEADDTSGVLLTWPIVGTFWGQEDLGWGLAVGIEPQYSLPDEAWRGAAFGQVSYFFGDDDAGPGIYNQSGYLIGQDGNGPFTSIGIAYGHAHIAQIGVLSRLGSYDGDLRFEIGLDVQLHWLVLWLDGAF